jgi:hypothetical protein
LIEVSVIQPPRTEDYSVDRVSPEPLDDSQFTVALSTGLIHDDGESSVLGPSDDFARELGEIRVLQPRHGNRKAPDRPVRSTFGA